MSDQRPFANFAREMRDRWPDVYPVEHAAESRRLLQIAGEDATYVEDARGIQAQAQVHATLALVEQQRIANLIAFQSACPVLPRTADAIRAEVERGMGLL